jgi:hypothetical protein
MRPVQLWLPEKPPERRALLVLLHALDLAQHAVREQHPRLEHLPLDSPPSLPASELLAELVVERSAELSEWIQRYNRVIDDIIGEPTDPF